MTNKIMISDYELVNRAIRNVRNTKERSVPRWSLVMNLFAVGSTCASNLCVYHGVDPNEELPGTYREEEDED